MRTSRKRALDAERRRLERDTRLDELAEAEGDDIVGEHDSAWEPYDYGHDPERNTEYRSELCDLSAGVRNTPGAANGSPPRWDAGTDRNATRRGMTDDDLDDGHIAEGAFLAYVADPTPGNELAAELAIVTLRRRHDVLLGGLDEQQTTRPVVVEQDGRLVAVTGVPNNVSVPTQAVAAPMRLNRVLASGNEVSIRGWDDH